MLRNFDETDIFLIKKILIQVHVYISDMKWDTTSKQKQLFAKCQSLNYISNAHKCQERRRVKAEEWL